MSDVADRLRREFDRAFASAPDERVVRYEDFAGIGVGAHAFALPLDAVSALVADKPLTRLPTPVPELLGVAGFRGMAVPVYDLRALLGESRTATSRESSAPPRWLALVKRRGRGDIALAFERFEGHVRVEPTAIALTEAPSGGPARRVVRTGDVTRPVVDVASVIAAVEKTAHSQREQRER